MENLNDDYLLVLPSIRGISVFDSIYYDTFDLELLGPKQREYLLAKALASGFVQKSGRILVHPDGQEIHFPANRLFNRNFRNFIPKVRRESSWLALTPTQAAFLVLEQDSFDDQDLYQLMMKHPFNVEVLERVTAHEAFFPRLFPLITELKRLAERAQVMLRSKKPLS